MNNTFDHTTVPCLLPLCKHGHTEPQLPVQHSLGGVRNFYCVGAQTSSVVSDISLLEGGHSLPLTSDP